jgi:glycosyltransferase involved in cell wall biosynthesis
MISAPRLENGATSRVALVHDYFTQRGGAERVAEHLAVLFPGATLHTSVVDVAARPRSVDPGRIRTTALQHLRFAGVPLKAMAPFLAAAFHHIDLDDADVVVSSSSAFAHHARPRPGAVHICYCHTPAAFLWGTGEYFNGRAAIPNLARPGLAVMRRSDVEAAGRVDVYVANSQFTADRIERSYGRQARVIHPPIATGSFAPSDDRSGRFLVVARLRPHKAIDLAVAAANELRLPLDVIGDGSDRRRLEALAGPTVRFLGRRSDADVASAMARCAGLLVPGIEDFGMATAEVQAAGRPPIALAAGGTTEIVRDRETGFLFTERTPAAAGAAMLRALREDLDPAVLVASARRFDVSQFDRALREVVGQALAGGRSSSTVPSMTGLPR